MVFKDPKVKKRMTIMLVALFVLFGGIIAFNMIKGVMIKRYFANFEPAAVSISSAKAREENWIPRIAAVGSFVAINGVDVSSQASGNVMAIHFKSGEYIEQNEPLIDIDDSVIQATLKHNQAELTLQEINYKRQTDLFKRGATSNASVDEAQAKLLQAQANVEKTRAAIKQKHIVAPFSGQVGIRQINLGQYINPGQTSIVTLQSMDPLFFRFYIPEQWLGRVKINQTIRFTVEQHPQLRFEGKITAINAKVDSSTHTVEIEATLPNCPTDALRDPSHSPLLQVKNIKGGTESLVLCNTELNEKNKIKQYSFVPGMFASIDIEQPAIAHVVVVPATAVSYSLYGNSVFVIQNDASHNQNGHEIFHVKRVFVKTGDRQGNDMVITKGIKPGELVAASGELKLQDGTRVTINNRVPLNTTENLDELGQ